jgi:dihydroorotase
MIILLKKATIVDPSSKYHLQQKDILIENGSISKIASNIKVDSDKTISSDNLHVSLGWTDIGTHLNDPGFEHREDFATLANIARSSGYTRLAPFPTSSPTIQHKSDVMFLLSNAKNYHINIVPVGAMSINREGVDITEMMDLHANGVTVFSDGMRPIKTGGMLERALQYSSQFEGTIISYPSDLSMIEDGQMHQGVMSTKLGFKGSPDVAEHMAVNRDTAILKEVGGRLVLHTLSSEESVEQIRKHKKKLTSLFSTVSYHNLIATDEDLITFNVNHKVHPPLRRDVDKKALIAGLKDGTIDAIVSNHTPLEEELKKVEYPYAKHGSLGLETVFSSLNDSKKIPIATLIEKLTEGPAKCLNIKTLSIKEGERVDLTLFDPDLNFTYSKSKSQSQNSPFLGKKYKGKVLGTILDDDLVLN